MRVRNERALPEDFDLIGAELREQVFLAILPDVLEALRLRVGQLFEMGNFGTERWDGSVALIEMWDIEVLETSGRFGGLKISRQKTHILSKFHTYPMTRLMKNSYIDLPGRFGDLTDLTENI